MTRVDIIKAAFKVWGRDFYRTTSLSHVAQELGVSKPALYRHFMNKEALLQAMFTFFFDDCCTVIKKGCDMAIAAVSRQETYLILMRTIGGYYIRNKEAFIFSLVHLDNSQDRKHINDEFITRGIDFKQLAKGETAAKFYPPKIQLVTTSLIFCIAEFHRLNIKTGKTPTDDEIKLALGNIENSITKGLGLDEAKVAALNYEALEKQLSESVHEDSENKTLLKAVAGAVAEAGPWNASMKMVARRSGLSKSSLYAHFKNRKDMISQLFITEFNKIVNFARLQIETSEVHEEQLYLAIISIVNYLKSRPEILVAIDWIKTRKLDLSEAVPEQLYRIIGNIKMEAILKYDQQLLVQVAQWVLFMIVNTLALWPSKNTKSNTKAEHGKAWIKNIGELPNESFRILFRFIALGLEGLNL